MNNKFLECTHDHPVFVLDKGYISAAAIQPGDELLSPSGIKKVKSIELNLPAPEFVYNLTTEPQHNFFANGILVHNCDDPIDPKRAVSEAELKTAADFVTNILPSRKVDKAVAVTTLVMQRLHETDPTGVLLAKSKEMGDLGRIRHICLPARLADNVQPSELRDKYQDGLMDPVRLPEMVLREQEILLGAYSFSGQYQQCLIGSTIIETTRGSIPIMEVKEDDLVLTRQGYKKVLWSGMTKMVERIGILRVPNGRSLAGTDDHPIWTEGNVWIPMKELESTPHGALMTLDKEGSEGHCHFWLLSIGPTPVYDLEIDDAHEFFANGILVHNSPVPLSGGMFQVQYFNQRCKAAPYHASRIRYWDRASTQDGGCYTAGVLMAKDEKGNYYIEHCVHGQWEPDKRNDIMRATALADRARYGPSHEPLIYVEAEGGSSGRDAWKGVARALAGFPIREHRPTGKKEIRAEPLACQLASGTFWLVEDGTWDINNYIQEHVHFPLGRYKDQVDSSSAAFSLLCQQRPTGGLRSYTLSHKKKQALRILICTPEQLINFSTVQRCLLIYLSDPLKGVMSNEGRNAAGEPIDSDRTGNRASSGEDQAAAGDSPADNYVELSRKEAMSTHGLPHVLDTLHLHFLNASPADYQNTWLEPVAGYEVLPEQLLLSKTQCKQLWQRITIHRDPWIENIILVDEDTNRSTSVALAICDCLQLPRDATLGWIGKEDWHAKRDDKPVQQWLYDFVRLGRNLVV